MHANGEPVDPITLADELDARGQLETVGGRQRIHELAALATSPSSVRHHAQIVHEMATLRDLIRAGGEISRLGWDRPGATPDLVNQAQLILDTFRAARQPPTETSRIRTPNEFLANAVEAAPIWGDRDQILAAAGETTMLVGPQGVGKTTIAQRYALARAGYQHDLLGMPVRRAAGKVLYVAADRPRQAARSLARMLTPDQAATLQERLVFWEGPLPFSILENQKALAAFVRYHDASDVILDSLKDMAIKLSDDDVGSRVNLALQETLATGVEILALHHQRKAQAGNTKPNKIDDVYGSIWITSGCGSVLLLWGAPGDAVIEMRHLKQPSEEAGPLQLVHDHPHGNTSVQKTVDLDKVIHNSGSTGITVNEAACLLYATSDPNANQIEKARRRLERGIRDGTLHKSPVTPGQTATYLAQALA